MSKGTAGAFEKRQTSITVTLALTMLLASLGTSIANIALPVLAEAFLAPFAQVQAVVVGYLATMTLAVVIAGRLGDRHGLRSMLIVGLGTFTFASVLCAIAPNLWLLVGARALQGVGAAFLMTLAIALMRQTACAERSGRAMGLLGTASALGTALGPTLGGLLIPITGWRGIFWVQVPLAVLALIGILATSSDVPDKHKKPLAGWWLVLNRSLATNLMVNFLVAAVMMTTLVVGPFYLGVGLGLGVTQVGLVMAIGPVISIFSGVPSGRLVDGLGSRDVLIVGLILLAAGAFLMALLPGSFGVVGYGLAIIVLTPGYQLFQAANNTAALADLPQNRLGTVSGLLALSRNAGLIAGASAMGAIFALGVGTQEFAKASNSGIETGLNMTFLTAGGMMIFAITIALWHRNAHQ